jgi:hypothetical protein
VTIADQAHILERAIKGEPHADLDVLFVVSTISPATAGNVAHRLAGLIGVSEVHYIDDDYFRVGPNTIVAYPKPEVSR